MINLLYCGNYGVFDGMLTGALSILKRSRLKEPLCFYVFTMDVSYLKETYTPVTPEQIRFFEDVIHSYSPEHRVVPVDVTELYKKHLSGCANEGAYCSPYTLIRLLADLVEGMPDKLLYLDCDLLFNRDIQELYSIDVSGVEYAAARDHYGKYLIYPNYINAGVLLFNMKKMKETGIFEKARGWLHKKKLTFADQSALIRSTTVRKMLPQKFNDQKFLHRHTVVRHFSKRLFWLPYPHTENIKQWKVSLVHKKFHYYVFDDILYEYLYLIEKFRRECRSGSETE
ncbi:MAG: lipopolysaccharide biosynthesis protein [Clostridia bacterium]|nr:lipopolysaccharide biosynthesis protein [Clostridia bacterium]